ncbi:MAG: hypothetical protein H0U29_09525, partial [Acidimicrobiia bacterium]|nr:hypothetical protein [Acidimicrobiia bacterium]
MIVPLVAAMLALAVGAVVVGTQGPAGPAPGEALVDVDGVAIVNRTDGSSERVVDRTRLVPGDRLTMESGTAELELNDDVRFSAVSATGGLAATDIEMAKVPRLLTGPLLVVAPRDTELRAGDGDIRLQGPTAARVSHTLAARVDVFRGRAVLDSAGRAQGVPALRSAEVVAKGEITLTRPVSYRTGDHWDRQYLGPAIALDRELSALESGLRTNGIDPSVLGERLRTQLDDAPSRRRLRSLLSERDGALDAVLGLVVVGSGDKGTFADRWRNGFRFHDAGARWGLVAMDVAADPDAIIDVLLAAVDGTPTGTSDQELAGASGEDSPGGGDPVGGG